MLRDLSFLEPGKSFPPGSEKDRLDRYRQNCALFEGGHFGGVSSSYGARNDAYLDVYRKCASRISRVIGNFEDVISFPVLLNYQRLMTLKMADLVCGEYPAITGSDAFENNAIDDTREYVDFDSKMYQAVIDISRYGEAIQRLYIDDFGRRTFVNWDPRERIPVVSQDGTNTVTHHCLFWLENRSNDKYKPDWYMHVQIHGTSQSAVGEYTYRVYKMDSQGTQLRRKVLEEVRSTGLNICAVHQLKAFSTTNTIFGYDDYMMIDSLLSEIMTRIGQISVILDKHADPSITGPASMLETNPETGDLYLATGKFYATSEGETSPRYMTWDGHLSSAFQQLEMLINQLYILSEMGAALLGSTEGGGQAISGAAMRFKMVNPIAKARRISNSLTKPVKRLFSELTADAEIDKEHLSKTYADETLHSELPVPYRRISVTWYDGLPDDPRENIEMAKLATGATKMMPLEHAIMEYFGRTHAEALDWIETLDAESAKAQERFQEASGQLGEEEDPNKPGPQDGTGVNTAKKGSVTGLNSFHGINNR